MADESWVDEQIRQAVERGEFDDLPGAGKPIEGLAKHDPDWWIKAKMDREGIEAPPSEPEILRGDIAQLGSLLAGARTEPEAREIVTDLNKRIRTARVRAARDVRAAGAMIELVDVAATIDQWRERRRS